MALSAMLSLVVFSSCQKEGDTGPEGPAGPAGPQGPQGPQGPTGVANVIYSEWLDVEYGWVVPEPGDTLGLGALIEAPKLTADIVNTGEVKVYVNLGTAADPYVTSLPYVDAGIFINASFYEGSIELFSNVNAGTQEDGGEKFLQYRYVLIPGGVLAKKPDNIKLDNYADVQKYLKLKD